MSNREIQVGMKQERELVKYEIWRVRTHTHTHTCARSSKVNITQYFETRCVQNPQPSRLLPKT
jgi:hypothetical protein